MFLDIIIEILKAIGKLLANPLLYVTLLFTVFIGYQRVKAERKSFNTRIHWGLSETLMIIKEGWLPSLILSLIMLVIGVALPVEYIILVALVSLIGVISFYYKVTSAAYSFSIAFFIMWLLYTGNRTFSIGQWAFDKEMMHASLLISVPLLVGILLIVEGFLVKKYAAQLASPALKKTVRGLNAVTFSSKRLWILPVFFLIPGDALQQILPFWPVFSLGQTSFGLIIFPIVIGFQQRARKMLPVYFYPQVGRAIMLLGVLVFVEGIIAFYFPIIGFASLIVAVVGRIFISIFYAISERKGTFAIMPKNEGVVIAAVLPNSPAEAMGLQIGEVIRKVNGEPVHTEAELYEALQRNAAHCKLEVLDVEGELKLRQHVIFNHDHFRIGLLIVK